MTFCNNWDLISPAMKASIRGLEKKNAALWRRLEESYQRSKWALARVEELEAAIEQHRETFSEMDWVEDADLLLWSILDAREARPR